MPDSGTVLNHQQGEVKGDKQVLLAQNGTESLSRVFRVSTKPLRLLSFGLSGTDSIRINRVWTPASTGGWDNCGEYTGGVEELERPFRLGCKVLSLTPDVPELVLDAAGEYRVEFVGDNRPAAHVVIIEDDVVTVDAVARGGECFCACETTTTPITG